MDSESQRRRFDPKVVEEVLDQLDADNTRPSAVGFGRAQRRRYRDIIQLEIAKPGSTFERYHVPTRNLGCTGMSFLMWHFIYPGTRCRIELVSPDGQWHFVDASVKHCEYLMGTGSLHEVNVEFDERIDAALLCEPNDSKPRSRVLVVDDDVTLHRLVAAYLKDARIELTCVVNGLEAIDVALGQHFDLIIMDLELPEMSGLDVVHALREQGCYRPVIAVSARNGPNVFDECVAAGCVTYVPKPLSKADLLNAVRSSVADPLVSSYADQPEMVPVINEFVASLGDKLHRIREAFHAGELDVMAKTVRLLKGGGSACGFEPITEVAAMLEQQIECGAEVDELRAAVDELNGWCHAARPVEQDSPPSS